MSKKRNRKTAIPSIGVASLACLLTVGAAGAAHASFRVGWVWASLPDATSPYTPGADFIYNSASGAITVHPISRGNYVVEFDNLYDGAPSNVQVAAYQSTGYCVVVGWTGSDTTLDALVRCFDATGVPANTRFTLLYQSRNVSFGASSAGLAYLFADQPSAASYTPLFAYQYNSTGATNTIVRNAVGSYTATIPGLTTIGGDVQVTAYGTNAARCTVHSWLTSSRGTKINVFCWNGSGRRADEKFDLAYALNESFGLVTGANSPSAYAYANFAGPGPTYTPSLSYQYNSFRTGRLTATRIGTGTYIVSIPPGASFNTSTALVAAYGQSNLYCNLVAWDHTVSIEVACYGQGGGLTDSLFDVTLQGSR